MRHTKKLDIGVIGPPGSVIEGYIRWTFYCGYPACLANRLLHLPRLPKSNGKTMVAQPHKVVEFPRIRRSRAAMNDIQAETIIYAAIATTFFFISIFSNEEEWLESVMCTGVLVLFWVANTIFWLTSTIDMFIISDTTFAIVGMGIFLCLRRIWCLVLSMLYLATVTIDVAYMVNRLTYAEFAWTANVLFVLQLAAASFPGSRTIIEKIIRRPRLD